MSEHKFLRILRGYAEGIRIQDLAPTTHVSGKTVRATYRTLRLGLMEAVVSQPERFGSLGFVLVHAHADRLLHAVRHSRRFRRHIKRHAPRLSCPMAEEAFVAEKLVRLFCALDLRALPLQESKTVCGELIHELSEAIPRLHPREPAQKLTDFITGSKPHEHPSLRLFDDYRRHLLKRPLSADSLP